jgi:hypothetical protein
VVVRSLQQVIYGKKNNGNLCIMQTHVMIYTLFEILTIMH